MEILEKNFINKIGRYVPTNNLLAINITLPYFFLYFLPLFSKTKEFWFHSEKKVSLIFFTHIGSFQSFIF